MTTVISPLIRILLVDDREIMLCGFKQLINEENQQNQEMEVVETTSSISDAERLIRVKRPNITILKASLGDQDSLQSIPDFAKDGQTRVIVLTHINDFEIIDCAMLNGAHGVVHEKETKFNILKAIRKIHAGELWIDRNTTSRIFKKRYYPNKRQNATDLEKEKIASLTRKEKLILKTFAQMEGSAQNKQIATMLSMGDSTLRNHLTSIFSKLEIKNRYDLFMFAKRHYP